MQARLPKISALQGAEDYSRGRVTYIIDKSGIVRDISRGMPDNQKILGILDGLMHGGAAKP